MKYWCFQVAEKRLFHCLTSHDKRKSQINSIMDLTSHWSIIFSIRLSPLILIISLSEIKWKMHILQIIVDRSFICIFTFLVWLGTFSWYMGTVNSCKNMPSCIYLDLLRRNPWNTDVSRWQKNVYFTAWRHMTNEKEHLISANKSVLFQFFPIYSI
jgi:hypothetical protein